MNNAVAASGTLTLVEHLEENSAGAALQLHGQEFREISALSA